MRKVKHDLWAECFHVRGIRLKDDKDEVIGMVSVNDISTDILVVSKTDMGKDQGWKTIELQTEVVRGKTISITGKTGSLVAIKNVSDENDLMIINKSGIAIRMSIEKLRVMGRATQGVKLINLKGEDTIAAVAKVIKEDETDDDSQENSPENEDLSV